MNSIGGFAAVAFGAALLFSGCRKEQAVSQTDGGASLEKRLSEETVSFPANTARGEAVPNELIVRFKPGVGEDRRQRAFEHMNAEVVEKLHTQAMKDFGDERGYFLVRMPADVPQAMNRWRDEEDIEYAEPNYLYSYSATSNDPYFTDGQLWGMYGSSTSPSNQYGTGSAAAWANNHTGSNSVIIAVIDEGIYNEHEDLNANCWVNPYEIPNNKKDDDGNGYVDDVYGWNFDRNNNKTSGSAETHGSHVAGTIGAVGGNNKGVAGVCWNIKMISCKFLGRRGGSTANAIKAVDYVTDMKTRHNLNIVATNNSWGGGGFSQSLKDAIDRAEAADILFIAAAGNDSRNNDASASYPSNYTSSNIIAVASITSSGGLSSFSNYGLTTVDIGAPGSGIYSTVPKKQGKSVVSSYASYNGTSMATPHVTGAAALYAASHPGSSAAAIKTAILSSATATSSLSGKCATGGRLNTSGF
ncbi:MAG: S8 family serine peptidase [Chitinophagales bacterium]|nr:S8 family serine peptidase [Chitinophagales bacterium]